ncbi:MAG: hypothetical protein IKV54_08125, partial [Clostridia bacterium]|nr:hypothetical protein [Clostridia bacterium]
GDHHRMTYALIAFLIFSAIAFLITVNRTGFIDTITKRRLTRPITACFCITGIILVLVSHAVITLKINAVSDNETFVSWAQDMFGGWYSISLPIVGTLLLIDIIAAVVSLFDKKQREKHSVVLRSAVLAASAAVPLLLAPFQGFMTANDTVPLYPAILVSGIGMALVFPAVSLIEKPAKAKEK